MAINKVQYGNNTLIDLSQDTVASAADIVSGKVGHLRDGSVVTGTASAGGGGVFIINISQEKVVNPEDETDWYYVYHSDKTQAEVEAAYNGGAMIVAKTAVPAMQITFFLDDEHPHEEFTVPDFNIMTEWTYDPTCGGLPIFSGQYFNPGLNAMITYYLQFWVDDDAMLGNWDAQASLLTPQG